MTVRTPMGWVSVAVRIGNEHAIAPGGTTCWSKVSQICVGVSRARSTPPQGKRPLMVSPVASVHSGWVICSHVGLDASSVRGVPSASPPHQSNAVVERAHLMAAAVRVHVNALFAALTRIDGVPDPGAGCGCGCRRPLAPNRATVRAPERRSSAVIGRGRGLHPRWPGIRSGFAVPREDLRQQLLSARHSRGAMPGASWKGQLQRRGHRAQRWHGPSRRQSACRQHLHDTCLKEQATHCGPIRTGRSRECRSASRTGARCAA